MLVKCVCAHCTHSYLADDQVSDLACPRCGTPNEDVRNPSDIPDTYAPPSDPFLEDLGTDSNMEALSRFDPKAPPPMFVTRDRFFKGIVFGSLAAAFMGAMMGASLSALGFVIPAAATIVFSLAAGASCRYGFGGRSARQTRKLAAFAAVLCVAFGFGGFFAGSWTVERLTGGRAAQTRADLDNGLQSLLQQRARTKDAGAAIVLDQRIAEVERLRRRSDAELEDYLWVQEAQFNQPLVAYAKLRATRGPVVRLGPEAEPITVPDPGTPGILLAEVLVAIWIASRGVAPRSS